MKKVLYFSIIIIFFVPLALVDFVTGGVDAIAGTELHKKFCKFFERIKYRMIK
jgi:hypothetical protein